MREGSEEDGAETEGGKRKRGRRTTVKRPVEGRCRLSANVSCGNSRRTSFDRSLECRTAAEACQEREEAERKDAHRSNAAVICNLDGIEARS